MPFLSCFTSANHCTYTACISASAGKTKLALVGAPSLLEH